jgi:hypothetical protein
MLVVGNFVTIKDMYMYENWARYIVMDFALRLPINWSNEKVTATKTI